MFVIGFVLIIALFFA